jgi:hypothetical protein
MNERQDPGRPTSDEAAKASPSGLDAGGHEPAPPSKDPGADEARDAIQDAFNDLEATRSSDALWDAADRRADEQPAPGTTTGDEAAGPEEAPAGS